LANALASPKNRRVWEDMRVVFAQLLIQFGLNLLFDADTLPRIPPGQILPFSACCFVLALDWQSGLIVPRVEIIFAANRLVNRKSLRKKELVVVHLLVSPRCKISSTATYWR
jgi:hypothetical protein